MNKICLFGASGHGKAVKNIADSANIEVEVFIDDNPKRKFLHKIPVIASHKIASFEANKFVISIGNNNLRKTISKKIKSTFAILIHKTATIAPTVNISEGTVVMARTTINADSIIGKHVILNTASIIEHDCNIGNFVHISPNATITGNVTIGEGTHIGAAAVIIPNIIIGKWCVIGAGSVVIEDIPDFSVVVGNPGRIIKTNFIKK